jgi:hypothetical protein
MRWNAGRRWPEDVRGAAARRSQDSDGRILIVDSRPVRCEDVEARRTSLPLYDYVLHDPKQDRVVGISPTQQSKSGLSTGHEKRERGVLLLNAEKKAGFFEKPGF